MPSPSPSQMPPALLRVPAAPESETRISVFPRPVNPAQARETQRPRLFVVAPVEEVQPVTNTRAERVVAALLLGGASIPAIVLGGTPLRTLWTLARIVLHAAEADPTSPRKGPAPCSR